MPILLPKGRMDTSHGGNYLQDPQEQRAKFVHQAYELAIREKYKFSTYGDAMVIL